MTARRYKKTLHPADRVSTGLTFMIGLAFIVISIIMSGLYLFSSWNRYEKAASSDAITLGQSLEALLQPEHIAELSGGTDDLGSPDYMITKHNLSRLVQTTKDIEFAYLMAMKNGSLVILVDSESPDSPGYSPPGQVYEEADDAVFNVFRTGETVMAGPTTDRWGTWYSVWVPVKNPEDGQTIAVFGLDFPSSEWRGGLWKQMARDITIALFFIGFVIALFCAAYHYFKLRALNKIIAFDEALYHSVFDQAPIGIAIVNDKRFVSRSEFGNANMNPRFEEILGRANRELMDIQWQDITHPDDLQQDLEKFAQFKAGEIGGYSMRKRFLKPDGSYVWTDMKIAHFLDKLQDNPMHLCLIDDITADKATADSLKESERSKTNFLSNLPGMACRCKRDRQRTMQFVSAGCYDLTGYPPESFINNKDLSFNDIVLPEYRDFIWDEWERALNGNKTFRQEYEIITARGERKWVLEIGKGLLNEKGEAEALEGIILDITQRKKMENELIYISQHDSVTGLLNRNYLDNLLIKDHREHLPLKRAIISINMSTVSTLNKAYGFYYSQELIKKAAAALSACAAENALLFKAFDNRFAFYVKGYKGKNELMEFGRKIADILRSVLAAERIGAGIGIIEIDPDAEVDLNRLSKRVLIATEKAIALEDREVGICFYDRDIEMQIERDEAIKRELARIVSDEEDGGLHLQYQPILDLKTNAICGFEALARLRTEELGQIPPAVFIPIAEETKLIIPLGWKITCQAFSFLNRLKSMGYDKTYVSINFSAIQFLKHDFIDLLFKMMDEMQVNPENICAEITESVFSSEYNDINGIMNQLRKHGLSVAIDDFGTGYSSLSRVRELHIDCVKIDKYFIDKILTVHPDNAITGDIISIAHRLGHSTVAEGVEYEEQKQYLQKNGCDKIQGYLIGKPLDEDAAIKLIDEYIDGGKR